MINIKEIPGLIIELERLAHSGVDIFSPEVMNSSFYSVIRDQEEISLENCELSESAMILATKILASSPALSNLHLQSNSLGQLAIEVTRILSNSNSLKLIDISANNLGRYAVEAAQNLINIKTLRELDLGVNGIESYGLPVAQAIVQSNSLEALHIYANDLKSDVVIILSASPSLNFLNVNDNKLGSDCLIAINAVIASKNICKFHLGSNGLTSDEIQSAQNLVSEHNKQCNIEREGISEALNPFLLQNIALEFIGHNVELSLD